MDNFRGKVIVVTGSAGGIGRSIATAFLKEGAKVVLADVGEQQLITTNRSFEAEGFETLAVVTDVSKPDAVERLAVQAYRRFGRVDVLCNNAAVTWGGPATWESTLEDWQWVLGVNLMGVVHGIRSFVPRMIAQGGEAVVVNSSSILGLYGGYTNAVYPVSKHGVVVLSESLYNDFKRRRIPISVHVLCPSFVNTEILESGRTRPKELTASACVPDTEQAQAYIDWFQRMHRQGKHPDEVAQILLQAIRDGTFYVVTHPEMNKLVEHRLRAIVEGGEPTGIEAVRETAVEAGIEPPPKYFDEL